MIGYPARRAPLLALLAGLALVAASRADGTDASVGALKLLPADTAFYTSMLRNREQVDIVARSRAFATLRDLPATKFALQLIEAQLAKPDPQIAPLVEALKRPENKELIALLGEGVSDEIFVYGGSGWIDFTELALQVAGTMQYSFLAQVNPANRDKNLAELQARAALQRLNANIKRIRIPELVIGFKVKDTAKAEAQLKRLEAVIGQALGQAPPGIRDGFKPMKIGGSNLLNLTLDGSLVPWEELHIKEYEERDGEYDALLKKLKELKLSISIGVHQGYIVLAIGQSPQDLAAIGGNGKRLHELPEFKRLASFFGKRLTSIGYVSKALKATVTPKASDYADVAKTVGNLLPTADLPEESVKKLRQDIEAIGAEAGKNLSEPGASLSVSFLTEQGTEDYSFEYGTFAGGPDGSKPLTLLDHVGGSPIFWAISRSKTDPEAYRRVARTVASLFAHVDEAALAKLEGEQKEQYQGVKKLVAPLLKRFDEITGAQLLPALADGQLGIVLDAKWKSSQWHAMVPGTPKPLPLPEPGFLLGISDDEKFLQAMKGYYALINDALAAASEIAKGNIPDLKMPQPTVEKTKDGLLAYYPIPPELGLDSQVVPTAGVSKTLVVLTLSRAHTERLLKREPLKAEGSLLAELKDKPLTAASGFDWPAFVDAATPWVELGTANLPATPPGPEGDVQKQVRTVLEVLKVFRGVTSVTYYEDGVLVTRSRSVIRDLK